MKFSLSVNVALTEYPIEERIRLAAEIGYDGVDIYGDLGGYDPSKVRAASEKYQIPVRTCSTDNGFVNTLNKRWADVEGAFQKTMDTAKQMGMHGMAVPGGFKRSDFDDPRMLLLENAKRLAELGEKKWHSDHAGADQQRHRAPERLSAHIVDGGGDCQRGQFPVS